MAAVGFHRPLRFCRPLAANYAYSKTSATLLAPFNYLQIVSATTLGWLIFGQLPDTATAAGMALICCAGLGVVLVEIWKQRRHRALIT